MGQYCTHLGAKTSTGEQRAVDVQLGTVGKLERRDGGVVHLGARVQVVQHTKLRHYRRLQRTASVVGKGEGERERERKQLV